MTNHQDLKELLEKATPAERWSAGKPGCVEVDTGYMVCSAYFGNDADRDLVVAMRHALPTLLDEREALVGERDELLALQAEDDASFRNMERRAEEAEAQAAALVGEVEKLGALVDKATGFKVAGGKHDLPIVVSRRGQMEGPDLWAITQGGFCLNTDGEWEYEPLPSSRTDEYIARTRFPLEEALERSASIKEKS